MGSYQGRYPELDACRGIAILMMIIFHFFVDRAYIGILGPDPFSGLLRIFGMVTTILFICIAGISAHLKTEKTQGMMNQVSIFFRRGGELILIGIGITGVTWLVLDGKGYVVFGILHLIGTALILTPLLYRLHYAGILLGIMLIFIASLNLLPSGPVWLAWSGICPEDFYSVDYTPLIPWLSVFLFGLSVGRFLFPSGCLRYDWSLPWKSVHYLAYIGRHSLLIYLLHQPVLILLITAFSKMSSG